MILLPMHKDNEEIVALNQLAGWIYESHLWKQDNKLDQFPMTCQWCGITTNCDITEAIKTKGEEKTVQLCPKNPALQELIEPQGRDHA